MFICEAKHWKRDGTIIDVEINSHRISWQNKSAGFALVKDITAEKTALRDRQRSQALLEEAQRVARLGNWEYNLATGKINWSKQLFNLYDREPEQSEPSYDKLLRIFYPQDAEKLDQAVKRVISTGESYKLLLRVIKTNNAIMYVEAIGQADFNADGIIVRLYGTTKDITERIQAEARLRQSEARLVTTQKIAHVGSWELDVNTNQRTWSTETFEIFGLNPHQPEPSHAEFLEMVHPEDRTPLQTQITEVIPRRTPFCWEYRIIRPDGSIRYLESRAEVAEDSQGKVTKLLGAILDITERKQAELEIIESRDLREAIFNESADALFLVDPVTFLTTDCNHQALKMFGVFSKAELIGIDGYAFHKQPFTREDVAAFIQQFNQLGFWSQEVEYVTKQGNAFWGNIAMKRIRVAAQDMNLVRITDISQQQAALRERQQAEEKIKASLKEKEVLLKEIHHRVKNNLGIVSSLLQMQYRRTQDPQSTAILLDSKNRIASIALVHEKLYRSDDLANINFAQYIPDLTTHLFDSYNVSSTHIQLNIQVEDVNLDIETAIPCGLIINELVSNALKYAFPLHQNGEIQVSLSQASDDTLTLMIHDNGVGLPAEFESKKTKTLGMTLIQGLVRQLRGTLEINSQQGTEFKICFTADRT